MAYVSSVRTFVQLVQRFRTEGDCLAHLTKLRWPKAVTCPKCGNSKVYRLGAGTAYKWICKLHSKTVYRFSPLVGTIFENTNADLRTWFRAIYLMCHSKKGMNALHIQRALRIGSYKTAWYMCHRVRAAMHDIDFQMFIGDEVNAEPGHRYPLEFDDALQSLIVRGHSGTTKTRLTRPRRSSGKREKVSNTG
jgi:transposase-like protein